MLLSMNGSVIRSSMLRIIPPFIATGSGSTGLNPKEIRVHEDLLALPLISGKTIREHQPPVNTGIRVPLHGLVQRLLDPGDERHERNPQRFFSDMG